MDIYILLFNKRQIPQLCNRKPNIIESRVVSMAAVFMQINQTKHIINVPETSMATAATIFLM
jgi:hypothetical protein